MKKLILLVLILIPILGITQSYHATLRSNSTFEIGGTLTPIKQKRYDIDIIVTKVHIKVYINSEYFGRVIKSDTPEGLFVFFVEDRDEDVWEFIVDSETDILTMGYNNKYTMFNILTWTGY